MFNKDSCSVKEAIELRRSIRRFKPDPVPDSALHQLLEAARLAPSGSNTQPWRFMIIKEREHRLQIAGFAGNQRQLREAPVVIICCGDLSRMKAEYRNRRRQELRALGVSKDIGEEALEWIYKNITRTKVEIQQYVQANVYIAIEHMVLRAVSLGLGTCWIGAFQHGPLHRYLRLPDHLIIVALLPVGYPAQSPKARPRLPMSEILLPPPE